MTRFAIQADGNPVDGIHWWVEVKAKGIADLHTYTDLFVRIEIPRELTTNTGALRRLALHLNTVADNVETELRA